MDNQISKGQESSAARTDRPLFNLDDMRVAGKTERKCPDGTPSPDGGKDCDPKRGYSLPNLTIVG